MKGLLIDENLPLPTALPTNLTIHHSTQLGLQSSDTEIWSFAKVNDLAIVTKDADFSDRISLTAPPPRVVHIRVGNLRRKDLIIWLYKQWPAIEAASFEHKLVTVYFDHLELIA